MQNSLKPLLLALLLLSPVISWGQDRAKVVKTDLLTLSFNGHVPGYYYLNGKEVSKMVASSSGISSPNYYEGPPVISLFKNKADLEPVADGAKPPKPQFQVKIPTGADRVLIVFAFTDRKKPPALKAYGINDDSLGEGDYRFFNFSKQKIYAVLKDKKSALALSPNKQGTIDTKAWGKKVQSIPIKLGYQDGETVKNAYGSLWGHRPERRYFIFVLDQEDPNQPLNIQSFYDVPSYKPPRRVTKEVTPAPGVDGP